MQDMKVFKIQKNIHEDNQLVAKETRNHLKTKSTYLVNIMSSPGSGKTTTLVSTIKVLKKELAIGVMEADVDSDVDARTVQNAGAKAIQLHTGGLCHLDATMTRQGLDELGIEELDLVFLENIGNLICPAGYDTGAMKNVAILSVPEGDDKPLKYPKIFCMVDALIINKIDALEHFDFDFDKLESRVRALNPDIVLFKVSAKTGEGIDEWAKWLTSEMRGEGNDKK
ncbi:MULTISPECIES: hydrogenase nickel incorporation protein HypB [unclassified Fusibacter]|uniref:hydrogenase nickel incorporation protein HypB n=1 Tax=unclassified Fusibacter TaxID=2624464 RepID=UPI001011CFCC|nr:MULTISPECIES: hydrogenase nickel incorporation protein HypB [unclassified Fusibacter]MCK8060739.1 hydrogenase nickel incorporation protein HypB [Fusibacter sp. A2]NPE23035.1 hydrogenase nickel incorporation protein HypB [Fusibacter sp. A1]RXV59708.1 hydrogenase accessory protein HypB [Fusibacter sp. A1]